MDLTDLKTFLKIAETGSFSAAAERLHVTQPAVSKRLANLEQNFGTLLVERLPRNAKLTQAGELLRLRAEHIIREVDNTQAEIQNLNDKVIGTLHIATSHHIGLHRLPEEVRRYLKTYPQVELDMQFLTSEEAEEALLASDVELALMTLPQKQGDVLEYHVIWQDQLHFVTGHDHPLNSKLDSSELKTDRALLKYLTEYRAFLPGAETVTFQLISKLFNQHDLVLKPCMPTNYLETIKMMVSVGLGWGVLPKTMIDHSLVTLHTKMPLFRNLGAVFDKRRQLSSPAAAFLEQLQVKLSFQKDITKGR